MPYVLPAGSRSATTAVQLRIDTPRLFGLITPFWYRPWRPLSATLAAGLPACGRARRRHALGEGRRRAPAAAGRPGQHSPGVVGPDRQLRTAHAGRDRAGLRAWAGRGRPGTILVDSRGRGCSYQTLRIRPSVCRSMLLAVLAGGGVPVARYWRLGRPRFAALAGATAGLLAGRVVARPVDRRAVAAAGGRGAAAGVGGRAGRRGPGWPCARTAAGGPATERSARPWWC